jgi:hypothetical protein
VPDLTATNSCRRRAVCCRPRSGVESMRIALRLCAGIAVVSFALYAAIITTGAPPRAPYADCGAGYCDVTAADLFAALFAFLGGVFAALTGLLVVIAALRTRQAALGVGLALLIGTEFAAALVYVTTDGFQAVLFAAPGAYFAPHSQLPGYFAMASTTFAIMLALAPLPALLFTPVRSRPTARSSASLAPPDEPGLRPPLPPRLALTSLLLAGVSLVVLDRVADHYAVAGVGPAWPLLAAAGSFYVFWLVAWLLLMGSLLGSWLRWRPASVS